MKHLEVTSVILGILVMGLPFMGFWVGFHFGQRSVRLMPMRTERLQVTDRLQVERVIPEPENPVAVPVTRETSEPDSSVAVPPQYKDLLKQYQERGGN